METRKIRILAVVHNSLLREGISLSIQLQPDLELVAAVASAEEAVRAFSRHRPDVTLMDLDLPSAAGIAAILEILRFDPVTCVLGLCTYDEDALRAQAVRAGARRCITKDKVNSDLFCLVRDCARHAG